MGLNFREGNNTLGYHWLNGSWWWDSNLEVPANIWLHVAMVVSPNGVKLYLNGEESVHSFSPDSVSFGTMKIGSYKGWGSRNYNGLIEEVCIYNTCLTQTQIQELMYKTKNPQQLNHLIHYYQFNRNSGDVTDRVGINHGVLSGGASRAVSTAPIPFETVSNGNWENNSIWAEGQNAPLKTWSRVKIKCLDTLNVDFQLIELTIGTNATLYIKPNVNLNVSGR